MRAIGFDDADLKANQSGMLTQRQRDRLRWKVALKVMIVGLITLVICCFIGLAFFYNPALSPAEILVVLIVFGFFGLLFVLLPADDAYTLWRVTNADLRTGEVNMAEGRIRRKYYTIRSGKTSKQVYEVGVADINLKVLYTAYKVFREGNNYRLYFVPNTKTLLAAEVVAGKVYGRKSETR